MRLCARSGKRDQTGVRLNAPQFQCRYLFTRRSPLHHIKVPNALEEVPRLGASTRLFSATFAGDAFEHQKFMNFFRTT